MIRFPYYSNNTYNKLLCAYLGCLVLCKLHERKYISNEDYHRLKSSKFIYFTRFQTP